MSRNKFCSSGNKCLLKKREYRSSYSFNSKLFRQRESKGNNRNRLHQKPMKKSIPQYLYKSEITIIKKSLFDRTVLSPPAFQCAHTTEVPLSYGCMSIYTRPVRRWLRLKLNKHYSIDSNTAVTCCKIIIPGNDVKSKHCRHAFLGLQSPEGAVP